MCFRSGYNLRMEIEDEIQQHHVHLKPWRLSKGLTQEALGNMVGSTKGKISKLESGKQKLGGDWIAKISKALGVEPSDLLRPPSDAPYSTALLGTEPKQSNVVGQAAAGLWFDAEGVDDPLYPDIPYIPSRYPSLTQNSYLVVGDSMNERYLNGTYVVTVPYWQVRTSIQDGDPVVVERRDGSKLERTVKIVSVQPSVFRLESRSTNPKWAGSVITIPRGREDASDNSIEIVGLIIGSYKPEA